MRVLGAITPSNAMKQQRHVHGAVAATLGAWGVVGVAKGKTGAPCKKSTHLSIALHCALLGQRVRLAAGGTQQPLWPTGDQG
jgi:hypothetical protein